MELIFNPSSVEKLTYTEQLQRELKLQSEERYKEFVRSVLKLRKKNIDDEEIADILNHTIEEVSSVAE